MLKKSISLILFCSLFLLLLTALVVFIAPPSRVASWANWTFLGLSRERWDGAHLGMGLLFSVAGLAHLVSNWEGFAEDLRGIGDRGAFFTRPVFLGVALPLAVCIWSLAGMPPVRQMVSLSDYFKQRAVDTYGEPPYAEAQRSTLESLARRMGMDKDKALALLRLKNIKAESADMTLAEIARQNGVSPGGVFEALRMVMEPSGGNPADLPKDPPPGLGRRKLSDICEEYGLPQAQALARLGAAGLKAQMAWTLTETAKANNVLPITVYEALRTEKPTPAPVAVEVSPVPVPEEQSATTPASPPVQESGAVTPSGQPGARPSIPQPVPSQPAAPSAPVATPQPMPLQPQYGTPPATTPALPSVQPAQPVQPGHPASPSAPTTPPPGLERMMLQTFCREYDIPLSSAVQRLARHRITAFGDMTFEELSLENNRTPTDIMRLVVGQ